MKNLFTTLALIFTVFNLNAQCPNDIQPSCPIITSAVMEQTDNGDGTSDYEITIEWIQGTADNASLQWDVYSGSIICPEEYDDLGLFPEENCQPVNSGNPAGTIIDYLLNVPNSETVYMVAQGRTNASCGGNKCNQTFLEVAPKPLPVKLVKFAGQQIDDYIRLEWTTETEVQNEGFVIERSENAVDFEEIDFVEGNGTTTTTEDYFYRDETPKQSTAYYRLKQLDYDGGFAYSEIIRIEQRENLGSSKFTIYPNPVQGDILNIDIEEYEASSIEIVDNFGNRILFQSLTNHTTQISTNEWPKGIYNVIVISNNKLQTQRLVKN